MRVVTRKVQNFSNLLFVRGFESGPGIPLHVRQNGLLPGKLGVLFEECIGDKVLAAGMSGARLKGHFLRHRAVGSLSRNRAHWAVSRFSPGWLGSRRLIAVAA